MTISKNNILERMSNIKKRIEKLVNDGNLELASEFIDQYEKIVQNDVEIYSIKAIILILQKEYDKAKQTLNYGLHIDYNNFDINYNLAYLYEVIGDYELSLKYYKKIYEKRSDLETYSIVKSSIERIIENNKLNINVEKFLIGEGRQSKQKILILCAFYSIYTKEYIEKMHEQFNIDFDILTMEDGYNINLSKDAYQKIYKYKNYEELINILCLPEIYDSIHIHFLSPGYGNITQLVKNKCNKLIISIWGSDFYRTSKNDKEIQRNIVNVADTITFDNDITMNEFIDYFGPGCTGKTTINIFGLTALEHINQLEHADIKELKKDLAIPSDSLVITCGYNANPAHNHLEIISSLKKYRNHLYNSTYFVFPMTYGGNDEYINVVENELRESGLQYRVIRKFMNFDEIALLIKITDVLVQVQITDTLSATMLEHMYNGNVIITGAWLPYEPLKRNGVFYQEVNDINDVGVMVSKVINNLSEFKTQCYRNKDIVWKMSAWENTIDSWNNIYIKDSKALFNHKNFWNKRYKNKFNIETAGSLGLGEIYNSYLYKSKLDIIQHIFSKLSGNLKFKNILELGPGTGFFTEYFYSNDISSYLGIDISDVAVGNLLKRFSGFNFKIGDISNLDECTNGKRYDMIFAANVLLHLTDNEKFQDTIHNISNSIDENGYFINIEPITFKGKQANSLYHNIIDFEYFKRTLDKNDLEICSIMGPTIFMNYPFDYQLLGSHGEKILDTFNHINRYFSTTNDLIEYQKDVCNMLYYLDKLCILNYAKETCEKVLVIRKKRKTYEQQVNFRVEDIWSKEMVLKKLSGIKFSIDNINNEDLKYAIERISEILGIDVKNTLNFGG